jgi:hypothetical protein
MDGQGSKRLDLWLLNSDRTPSLVRFSGAAFNKIGEDFSRWTMDRLERIGVNESTSELSPGSKRQISTSSGVQRWRTDGASCYLASTSSSWRACSSVTFDAGAPAPLFRTRLSLGAASRSVLPAMIFT